MTFGDLLDSIAFDSGDPSSTYRTEARRWLNLIRSEIADATTWRSSVIDNASIEIDGSDTDGRYPLKNGSGTTYDRVVGEWMFNETDDRLVQYKALSMLRAIDPDRSTDSTPDCWADAGYSDDDDAGVVYFYPVPDSAKTVTFVGQLRLADISDSNDTDTTDAYFGEITPWAACFRAGLRYYHDLNNNEDANQSMVQYQLFQRLMRRRASRNSLSSVPVLELCNVRDRTSDSPRVGRFPPGHYQNY